MNSKFYKEYLSQVHRLNGIERVVAPPKLSMIVVDDNLNQEMPEVNSLTQSLAAISQSLALSSRLEEQRVIAEANRQRQLAALALREGKEGEIERKITNAALAPVQLISKKAMRVLILLILNIRKKIIKLY